MTDPRKSAKEKFVQCWEQAVQLHQQFEVNPSWRLALHLVKIVAYLLFQLVRLYIKFR